ncbi:NAD(P)H-binding protein [Micromonospora sp. WMMD1120]|uniref:NAD(P)H-binding protein n=1 Tax=Micromonospora sp. WMMD1120 TaxID=3016106 RepID=UPI0024161095|nr:NAD(P)H-binding protein [Micromonospora sp. WMMD1120]MDG4808757.1 NAD(P)H-binding protein [Micromonospora sp. WMMD1120]
MIVISTPTGTIGAAVAESLRAAGAPLRLIVRDPSRLPESLREYADVVVGSHADPTVLDTALIGATAAFVLVPPDFAAPDVRAHYLGFARPVAQAVRAHGVPRLVAVSSLGRGFAGPAGLLSAAWAMDEVLESSGAAYRSLQAAFFMENLLHQVELIRDQGMFVLPADPDAPLAAVATGDIARAAVELLADRTWSGQRGVPVREPVDHTPRQMAQIMSESLGRPVTCHQATLADYRARYASFGASAATLDAMVEMAEAQAAGVYPPAGAAGAGTTFRQWCESVLAPAVLDPARRNL